MNLAYEYLIYIAKIMSLFMLDIVDIEKTNYVELAYMTEAYLGEILEEAIGEIA